MLPLAVQKISPSLVPNLQVGAGSETGYVRKENEDRMSGSDTGFGRLFIVADGMGGYKGGAYAASLTDKTISDYVKRATGQQPLFELLKAALQEANRVVFQKTLSGNSEYKNMGSTAVVALILGNVMHIAHIGDSRAYLHRKNKLIRLTNDHTVGNRMIEMRILTEAQAASHPDADILDRGIGKSPSVEAEVSKPFQLQPGDAILLCTDGLSGYSTDAEINHALNAARSDIKKAHKQNHAQLLADQLIDLALRKGGEDNVTVQYIKYLGGPCPRRQFREILYLLSGLVIGGGLFHAYHLFQSIDNATIVRSDTEVSVSYTEEPSKDLISTGNVKGNLNGTPFEARTVIFTHEDSQWELVLSDRDIDPKMISGTARQSLDDLQGIHIDLGAEPQVGEDFPPQKMAPKRGYLYLDTIRQEPEMAWVIEITAWNRERQIKDGETSQLWGTASGKLHISIKGSEQIVNSAIAGTFENAPIVSYVKPTQEE